MPKVNRAQFIRDAANRSQGGKNRYSDWRKQGETTGYVHPKVGLWTKISHGAIPERTVDDMGKVEHRNRRANCQASTPAESPSEDCPLCLLSDFARQQIIGGADADEVVLKGAGEKVQSLTWNDLTGGGGYRTDIKARTQIAFVWIPKEMTETDPKKVCQIVTGPVTLGERIVEIVEDQIEARGEIQGDLQVPTGHDLVLRKGKLTLSSDEGEQSWTPYPLKLKYKAKAPPASMYSASKFDSDLHPITPKIAQLMLADADEIGIDMAKVCAPTSYTDQMKWIESSWDSDHCSFDDFSEFVNGKMSKSSKKETRQEPPKKKLPPKEEKAEDEWTVCPSCGEENSEGGKFCQSCGHRLGASPAKKVVEIEPEPEEVPDTIEVEAEEEQEAIHEEEEEEKPKLKAKPRMEETMRANIKDIARKSVAKPAGKTVAKAKSALVNCPECGEMVEPMKPSNRCPECACKIPLGDD